MLLNLLSKSPLSQYQNHGEHDRFRTNARISTVSSWPSWRRGPVSSCGFVSSGSWGQNLLEPKSLHSKHASKLIEMPLSHAFTWNSRSKSRKYPQQRQFRNCQMRSLCQDKVTNLWQLTPRICELEHQQKVREIRRD